MKAVFDPDFVRRINGPNVKTGGSKMDYADMVMDDITQFQKRTGVARMTMIWCGSTEVYHQAAAVHALAQGFRVRADEERSGNLAQPDLRLRGVEDGRLISRTAHRISPPICRRCSNSRANDNVPISGKDYQERPDLHEDPARARAEVAHARS